MTTAHPCHPEVDKTRHCLHRVWMRSVRRRSVEPEMKPEVAAVQAGVQLGVEAAMAAKVAHRQMRHTTHTSQGKCRRWWSECAPGDHLAAQRQCRGHQQSRLLWASQCCRGLLDGAQRVEPILRQQNIHMESPRRRENQTDTKSRRITRSLTRQEEPGSVGRCLDCPKQPYNQF